MQTLTERLDSGKAIVARGAQKIVFVDGAVVLERRRTGSAADDCIEGQFVGDRNAKQALWRPLGTPLDQIGDCFCGHTGDQLRGREDWDWGDAGQELQSR